jgi:hypothetical protein
MKNLLLISLIVWASVVQAQQFVQPVSSGDYWRAEQYNQRMREYAMNNSRAYPSASVYPAGTIGFDNVSVNRVNGTNELTWSTGSLTNVSRFYVEYSRDMRTFERAGEVSLSRVEDGRRYIFNHPFNDNSRVYYRVAVLNANNQVVGYSPLAQVIDEQYATKVFPTLVKGSTFQVQTGVAFEKLQVINSANQAVYEKDIHDVTGTITVGLPSLPAGVYFVRLLSVKHPQHVQKIVVE